LKEFKNVYLQGVNLITKISNEIKQQSTTGASSAENATIGAIHELTAEIRAFREVYMAVVSPSAPLNLLIADIIIASMRSSGG
jgi:hypothetical protein